MSFGRKIFGIGLERTGTTSLCTAMRMLGFRAIHFPSSLIEVEQHDFANDITVAWQFDYLDRIFPGSRFILTTRENTKWIDSCRRWYTSDRSHVNVSNAHLRLYNSDHFDADLWLAGKYWHEKKAWEYFANRPGDLLTMDICGGDGWKKLLPFLKMSLTFPRDNVNPITV